MSVAMRWSDWIVLVCAGVQVYILSLVDVGGPSPDDPSGVGGNPIEDGILGLLGLTVMALTAVVAVVLVRLMLGLRAWRWAPPAYAAFFGFFHAVAWSPVALLYAAALVTLVVETLVARRRAAAIPPVAPSPILDGFWTPVVPPEQKDAD
ncbi:hypothetical protein [Actinokineospora enzanensis]|uniref:hypothetical protein n=1 Tax=Actinokineospora enzanensis TaxID=155975 RepID=UPI00037D2E8B|nr:hypothetical protein [Actinokineospora enzanensis]